MSTDTMVDTRWDSVRGTITTEEINEKTYRVFRLSVHNPVHGWRAQAVSVEISRLEKYPWLYRYNLDLLVRELGIWDPQ